MQLTLYSIHLCPLRKRILPNIQPNLPFHLSMQLCMQPVSDCIVLHCNVTSDIVLFIIDIWITGRPIDDTFYALRRDAMVARGWAY